MRKFEVIKQNLKKIHKCQELTSEGLHKNWSLLFRLLGISYYSLHFFPFLLSIQLFSLIKMMSYNTQFNKTYDGKMRKYSYSEVHNQIQKVLLTDVRRCSTVPCILSAVEPLSWNCLSTSGLRVNSILCGFEIKMWYGLVYILFYWLSKTGAIA